MFTQHNYTYELLKSTKGLHWSTFFPSCDCLLPLYCIYCPLLIIFVTYFHFCNVPIWELFHELWPWTQEHQRSALHDWSRWMRMHKEKNNEMDHLWLPSYGQAGGLLLFPVGLGCTVAGLGLRCCSCGWGCDCGWVGWAAPHAMVSGVTRLLCPSAKNTAWDLVRCSLGGNSWHLSF